MDTIEELLPGLEEFLTITLASEKLSNFVEERRQFFIERLDIIRLPPSLPPREGRILPPELLKEAEEISGTPANQPTTTDFAATQREISRSSLDSNILTENVVDRTETSLKKGVKVYADIDSLESSKEQPHVDRPNSLPDVRPNECSDVDEDDDNEGSDFYEIPVARQQLSPESCIQSLVADGSSITTAVSAEELQDDVIDSTLVPPSSVPPPLPPRREIRFSDSGSYNSLNFDVKPPELPFRPPLPKRNELNIHSDKSDRSEKSNNSDPELSGDGESTSYESFEEGERQDTDVVNKQSIQLPKKSTKRMALKKSKKLSKSRSSSQWEISTPFRKLENIDISGELYYKGKLKWNRRIVAISNGCLAMYKPDKEARPSLVIPLSGYEAHITEREGRRGFEVKMAHPNADSHTFSVDFKEWALLWIEHINGTSKGQTPAKYHTHLARSFSGDADCDVVAATYSSKYDEIDFRDDLAGDCLFKDEGDCNSVKSSPVESLSSRINKKMLARHFQSEKSPRHSKRNTCAHTENSSPFTAHTRDRTISTTVKDILRRRQRAIYRVQRHEPCVKTERYTPKGDNTNNQEGKLTQEETSAPNLMHPVSPLTISRWNWKNAFYSWSMPLDQLILTFRRTDLNESNSNLSTGSEGGSEDSPKPKLRGSKVMRMGSFAFRATQFFENIGKKTTNKKKSHHGSISNFRHSADFTDVRNGIVEEALMPTSCSAGNLAKSRKTSSADSISSDVLTKTNNALSLPAHLETTDHEDLLSVTHKGYLLIFSSFNKRCWGKRWCLVRQNMFECYKSDSSKQCELNFRLNSCILRRAVAETNSENGLMLMDAGREKITVEPLSKEEMGQWVQVFLHETATQNVPEGLEEYIKEPTDSEGDSISVVSFSVLKQWDMDCLVPTKNLPAHDYEDPADTADAAAVLHAQNIAVSEASLHNNAFTQQDVIMSEHVNKMKDSLPVYQTNNHTTDSGFISAKGANSDSDSCHETCDLNLEFADKNSNTLHNAQHPVTFGKVTSLLFTEKKCDGFKDTSLTETCSNDTCVGCSRFSTPSRCACLSRSSPSLSSGTASSRPLPMAASECHLPACICTPVFQYNSGNITNTDCPHPARSTDLMKTDNSMSLNGEEYSMVLKRSERSFKSSLPDSDLQQAATNMKCEYGSNNSFDDDASCANNVSEIQKCSLAMSISETSYYEPICAPNYIANTSADVPNKLSSNNATILMTNSRIKDFESLPPIPTSTIPHLVFTSSHADTAASSESETHILNQSDIWPETKRNPILQRSNIVNSKKNVNENVILSAMTFLPESRGDVSTLEADSLVGGDQSLT
ncbi:hypothetical protein BsWGS_26766 [Bradybaena similaris]